MATCFRVPISMPASPSRFTPRRLKTLRTVNSTARSRIPFNPNDPFLSKLASVAASDPEILADPSSSSDNLPFLDIFDSPQLMATPAQLGRSASYGQQRRPRRPPPDLPSVLLNGRIVYIGMPLVPAVTELVIAELMYLQWMDPKEPINIYINSTGTMRGDGETVAMETEGFAIYDAMMLTKTQINTVALGVAAGQACLLLSAGTKGRRFMTTHAKAIIQQPRVPASGFRPASDVLINAREMKVHRDNLVKLLAKHTGNSEEKISNVMKRTYYMDALLAKEFGVIDKILERGQEKLMADSPSGENRF